MQRLTQSSRLSKVHKKTEHKKTLLPIFMDRVQLPQGFRDTSKRKNYL